MSEWQGGRARAPQSLRRLAAAALLLASPVAFGFERHSNDEIVRNFELVVFNEEHRDRAITRLRKWVRPVRIYLDVRVPDPSFYRRLTQATIDKLAKASGHDIRIVDNRAAANVVSTFARFDELLQVAQEYFPGDKWLKHIITSNLCTGRYYANRRGEIYRANIFIPTDAASSRGLLPACVTEETTQVLGLPNDSDDVVFSIFNDRSVFDDLTEHDLTLVRLLYDPRLRPGMGRDAVMRLVRRILPEIRR
jgi:hypothetical protein